MKSQVGNKDYRADIDGLRALAIVAVILYHIDSAFLSGGFTGVDVFFVISGFLITSHLSSEIYFKKAFSFKRFYLKRIKRIIPALLVMILLVIVAGYFIFTKYYFQSLGEQALSATLSYSNIYFYFTSGYFDLDASLRPLLHTWSLGVEEQFYLVWPLILVAVFYLVKDVKYVLMILVLFVIASLLLNKVYIDDRNAIFYLMPFRVFEFSVGAIVAKLMLNERKGVLEDQQFARNLISIMGLMLLVSPMMYLNKDSIFPYFNAGPTVLGAAILIYFKNTIVGRFLSLKLLVYIGLISYSLYLYHWPVIVFVEYLYRDLAGVKLYAAVIFMSTIMAVLSYHFIEKPFRFSMRRLYPVSLVILLCLALVASYLVQSRVIGSHNQGREVITKTLTKVASERYSLSNPGGCSIATSLKPKNCNWSADNQILFVGNSHNIDGYNIFHSILDGDPDYNLVSSSDSNYCKYKYQPDGSVVSLNKKCVFGAEKLTSVDFISSIDVLIITFFKMKEWGGGMIPIYEKMREINPDLKIIVLGGFIGVRPNICRELINETGDLDACKDERYVTYFGNNELGWLSSHEFSRENFLYIDRVMLLCGEDKVLGNCMTRQGNELFFYDGDHFSLFGARFISRLIESEYKQQLIDMGIKY